MNGGLGSKIKSKPVSKGSIMLKGADPKQAAKRISNIPYILPQKNVLTDVSDLFPTHAHTVRYQVRSINNFVSDTLANGLAKLYYNSGGISSIGMYHNQTDIKKISIKIRQKNDTKNLINYALDYIFHFVEHHTIKLEFSASFGLQANLKIGKLIEAEVNAWSIKLLSSIDALRGGKHVKILQVTSVKKIMDSHTSKDSTYYNAPMETKSAIGAKLFSVGAAVEATKDNDSHGHISNEKIAIKTSVNPGNFSTTHITEYEYKKRTEKIENSFTVGGALLIGVEMKIDLTNDL